MYEVHAFATPNSIKVPIALEELDLPYTLHAVNVRAGEQKAPAFLALNPNGKVPVLVDPANALVLAESAAILVYLAETTGRLLPASGVDRARVFEQLFFHASALSPNLGNAGWARGVQPVQDAAQTRFSGEANRLLDLLDQRLGTSRFVAGAELSIADIAHWGWLWRRAFAGVDFDLRPNLARWFDELAARPAFRRAEARINALLPA
ncbi:glutathione S-transferase family protein [Novosphingobium sp.]|uniref:glutathione S-transferase family protein n=1 Tax=Novosphingobium sp. TaxID=1874826 RepID=UPI00261F8979|nr:glutathione S-transferase family protein [Novosphingobium sp.]